MKRREFIAAGAALLVSPRRSLAQGTRRRVGFLATNVVEPTVQKAWLEGLRNHGWIDGRNLIIEYRFSQPPDRLPASVADLIALSPSENERRPVKATRLTRNGLFSIHRLDGRQPSEFIWAPEQMHGLLRPAGDHDQLNRSRHFHPALSF
jgi:putative ABC transport system substrate-binding protein